MKTVLNKLHEHQTLSAQDAYDALFQIATGGCNDAHTISFISAFMMRKPAICELTGFRDAMMELCIRIDLGDDITDIVGTGGDGKNTFNISTLSAIVAAGAGIKIAKHGNYGASSVSGSSNVLEYLGYKFVSGQAQLQKQLDQYNICFLHAPLFHPAMTHIAGIRKSLGLRTFFNLLGPIINPASPAKQVLGVSDMELARIYHYLLQSTRQQYRIVTSFDGYDEISLTDAFKVFSAEKEQVFTPKDIGFDLVKPSDIEAGETIADAAGILIHILDGTATSAQRQVVIVNAGFTIQCALPNIALPDCFAMAAESLDSKKAYHTFKQLIQ